MSFITEKIIKVLNLIVKNRKKIKSESVKLQKLEIKIQLSREKLNALNQREEKLRDIYDTFSKAQYDIDSDDDDVNGLKIRLINNQNRASHVKRSKTEVKDESERVRLPESFYD